jgi:nucleoside-diphosphate-sugar epimerase
MKDKVCQKCGSNENLQVDHFPRAFNSIIKDYGIETYGDAEKCTALWDVNNGRLLCKKCHEKTITSKNKRYIIANSNVCVVGGAGMIGTYLVDELIKRGNKVLVLDNLLAGKKEDINKDAEFLWYDIRTNPDKLITIFKEKKIDFVFHLASLPYIPECFDDPQPFFEINAGGTMNILRACEKSDVKKLLVYSSAEIYGYYKGKIKEDCLLKPQSTYGVAKISADRLSFIRYVEAELPVVINRQFNVFSPRANHRYIIPEIISQLLISDTVYLGNINSVRDFLYIEDAVNMVIELLEKGNPGEAYNVGSDKVYTIKQIAEIVGKLLGHKKINIKIDKSKFRPWDINKLQANTEKLYRTIKYRPQTSFEEGLKKTIEHYKQYGFHF